MALAGWVIFAALPSWSAIYSYFMQETLMLPLLGAALWATWRCRRRGDTASFVVATGAWLLAGLTRGICIPLAAVAMTWLWFSQDRKLEKAAISTALLLAVLVPLAGRSWAIARLISPHGIGKLVQLCHHAGTAGCDFEFTRSQGKERWEYKFTSPAVNHAPFAPFSDWRGRREWRSKFSIDLDAGDRDWKAARDDLPPLDLARATWLTGENIAQLLFAPSWPDSNLEKDRERPIGRLNYWLRWVWAPLTLACLILTLAQWRRRSERLLPALLLTFFLVHGVYPLAISEGRYRKPFEGLLVAQCLLLAAGTRPRVRSPRADAAAKPARATGSPGV
jgi:hypothetical protein